MEDLERHITTEFEGVARSRQISQPQDDLPLSLSSVRPCKRLEGMRGRQREQEIPRARHNQRRKIGLRNCARSGRAREERGKDAVRE